MERRSVSEIRQRTQYFASLVVSLGGFAYGSSIGWVTMTEPHIFAELKRPTYELAWIGSLLFLGGVPVMLPLPYVLDRLGRKSVLLLTAVLLALAWVTICVASVTEDVTTAIVLYCVGQFVAGVCSATFCVAAPMYVGEIAQKEIRGKLAVFFELFLTFGMMYSFVVGSLTDSILTLSASCGAVPVIFALLLLCIPETPPYLLTKSKRAAAEKSLEWFRGSGYDVTGELQAVEMTLLDSQKEERDGSFWEHMAVPGAKKAVVIGVGSMFCRIGSGIFAMDVHLKTIFNMSTSAISSNNSLLFIGALQIVTTGLAAMIVDKMGRKYTMCVSMAVMGLCHILLGAFFVLYEQDRASVEAVSWLPLLFISLFYVAFTFGAGPMPWAIIGEIFPANIKNVAVPLCIFVNRFVGFLVSFTFQFIVDAAGDAGPFWVYAATCVTCSVFVWCVFIETKGKTLQEIQTRLAR